MIDGISRIIATASLWLAAIAGYFKGRSDEKEKSAREELRAIKRAKAIRDQLIRDDDYARRVREQFRR